MAFNGVYLVALLLPICTLNVGTHTTHNEACMLMSGQLEVRRHLCVPARFVLDVRGPSSSRKGGVSRKHSASSQACQGSKGADDCTMVSHSTGRCFTAACMQAEQKVSAEASSQQDPDHMRTPSQTEASRPLIVPHAGQLSTRRMLGNITQGVSPDGFLLPDNNPPLLDVQNIYSNELAMASAAEEAGPAEWALAMPSVTATEQVRWGYRR